MQFWPNARKNDIVALGTFRNSHHQNKNEKQNTLGWNLNTKAITGEKKANTLWWFSTGTISSSLEIKKRRPGNLFTQKSNK